MKTLYYLFISMRPRQWIKNMTLFIPIVFWGYLLQPDKLQAVSFGVIIFCGLTSSIYLLNDLLDRKLDRLHPGKKNRPIARGLLNPPLVLSTSATLALISLFFAWRLSEYFFACSTVYLLLMVSYCLFFRNIIILDALCVAFGFVLRVWAGALVSETPISSWLILCTTAGALLISFGRRRCELTLLLAKASEHRHTLQHYPKTYLDVIIAAVTAFSLIAYSFYTFTSPAMIIKQGWVSYFPTHWDNLKWLMVTIPVVIYGIFRYLFVIYEKKEASTPEEVLFRDLPLLSFIVVWMGLVILIIYVF